MLTKILIENVRGSGQGVKLVKDFGDYSVCRNLRPGENTRIEIGQLVVAVDPRVSAGLTVRSRPAPSRSDPPKPPFPPRPRAADLGGVNAA